MSITKESNLMLKRAEDAILTAKLDLKAGFILATANRAYYAIFYSISALLFTEDVYSKSHKGTHLKFDELFIKTGKIPIHISKYISYAFNLRQEADYDLEADITEQEAQLLIDYAQEIYNISHKYIENLA